MPLSSRKQESTRPGILCDSSPTVEDAAFAPQRVAVKPTDFNESATAVPKRNSNRHEINQNDPVARATRRSPFVRNADIRLLTLFRKNDGQRSAALLWQRA